MSSSIFEIVKTTTGVTSIRNKVVNEIMHNPVGPWIEANSLYIHQSSLKERFQNTNEEFVLFDVGLGAAANALATLACVKSLKPQSFRLISFERDLDLLQFALDHAEHFKHFQGYEAAIRQILSNGEWSDGEIRWQLRRGDFLENIESEKYKAHIIFFDPYSPVVNSDMWTEACFKKIRERSRDMALGGTTLYTYSQATRIRSALIAAGFFVGYGVSTGLKKDTTEAATNLSLLKKPLGPEWYERFKRSPVRYPFDCQAKDEDLLNKAIHKYFQT